jgi:hypothetical protein
VLATPADAASLTGAIEEALRGGAVSDERRNAGLARVAPMTWDATASGHIAAYRLAVRLGGEPVRRRSGRRAGASVA